jgi:hypothetical protein
MCRTLSASTVQWMGVLSSAGGGTLLLLLLLLLLLR